MEKRVERNTDLYKEIDKAIEQKKKNLDNPSFNNAQSALSSVNPDLFGNSSKKEDSSVKKRFNKKLLIPIIIGVIVLVVLAVIIIL